jgi:hypothetical protein
MVRSYYTPQELNREAREAAIFSQKEIARLSHSGVRRPRSVRWTLEVFAAGPVRLEVEYLVKDDEHPHATSVVL